MKRALVLGAGMVGTAIAWDLGQDADLALTVADLRPDALEKLRARVDVKTSQLDLSDPARVRAAVEGYDVVLGALSSHLGFATLRAVIEAGRPYVDISFMAEDAWTLSPLAEARGVTAVVDCGVAPGMSNLLAGYAASVLQPCERIDIFVGGLPVIRTRPFEYKAGFAPSDVIEEYVRPARVVENGACVVKDALSEPERLDFERLGTLEAFNTDGLRSLATTLKVPSMREKTLRYPGHAELMRTLRDAGFFSTEPLELGGQRVRPLEVTSALLFPQWTYDPGEADLTVMRVTAEGRREGRRVRLEWDLFDTYDARTDLRSMSRTTGFTAAAMARRVLDGRFGRPGVHPPEVPGQIPGFVDGMLEDLRRRGVSYNAREVVL
jgi:saccharopine dehydrogenase-like NADP-dependent oxidoreductase